MPCGAKDRVVVAGFERAVGIVAIDIVADRYHGAVIILPPRGEGGGPCVAGGQAHGLGRVFEGAVAQAAQQKVRPGAHHEEIGTPVGVRVERVGAGDAEEVGPRHGVEGEIALVAQQQRRRFATRCENVGPCVVVAVEHRDAAAHEMLPPAGIDMLGKGR